MNDKLIKRLAIIIVVAFLVLLILVAMGNNKKNSSTEATESSYVEYAEELGEIDTENYIAISDYDYSAAGQNSCDSLIATIKEQRTNGWTDYNPSFMGLGMEFAESDRVLGYIQTDINEDGKPEVIFGENDENGYTRIYNLYTISDRAGMVTVFTGGESNFLYYYENGCFSNGDSSFESNYMIEDGMAEELDDETSTETTATFYTLTNDQLMECDATGKGNPISIDLKEF